MATRSSDVSFDISLSNFWNFFDLIRQDAYVTVIQMVSAAAVMTTMMMMMVMVVMMMMMMTMMMIMIMMMMIMITMAGHTDLVWNLGLHEEMWDALRGNVRQLIFRYPPWITVSKILELATILWNITFWYICMQWGFSKRNFTWRTSKLPWCDIGPW